MSVEKHECVWEHGGCKICGLIQIPAPSSLAAPSGSPTDADILDWLQTHCRMDWPFGNEIQVTARCMSLHAFKDPPSLREAVAAAIKSENTDSATG